MLTAFLRVSLQNRQQQQKKILMASANNAINFSPSSKREKWKIIFQFKGKTIFFPYSIPLMLPFATIWHEEFFSSFLFLQFSLWNLSISIYYFFYCCHKRSEEKRMFFCCYGKLFLVEMGNVEEWKMKILRWIEIGKLGEIKLIVYLENWCENWVEIL